MRFWLVPKSSTLDDLELLQVQIFSEFCDSWHVWEATTAKQVKIDPHCERGNCCALKVSEGWFSEMHPIPVPMLSRHSHAYLWVSWVFLFFFIFRGNCTAFMHNWFIDSLIDLFDSIPFRFHSIWFHLIRFDHFHFSSFDSIQFYSIWLDFIWFDLIWFHLIWYDVTVDCSQPISREPQLVYISY